MTTKEAKKLIGDDYALVAQEIVLGISNSLQQEWKGIDDPERDEIELVWKKQIVKLLRKKFNLYIR